MFLFILLLVREWVKVKVVLANPFIPRPDVHCALIEPTPALDMFPV